MSDCSSNPHLAVHAWTAFGRCTHYDADGGGAVFTTRRCTGCGVMACQGELLLGERLALAPCPGGFVPDDDDTYRSPTIERISGRPLEGRP